MLTAKTHANREAIRWALAKHLKGMREPANHDHGSRWVYGGKGPDDYAEVYYSCAEAGCPGYQPIPLDGGEISVGRLMRAIEAEGLSIDYHGDMERWEVYPDADTAQSLATDPDLAVAYLKAVEAWPVKEDAHANA